jgi:hypothetical protein
LSKAFTRDYHVVVSGVICRAIRPVTSSEKLEQGVGLPERNELSLAKLSDESLAAER